MTADDVRAERERLGAETKKDLAAVKDKTELENACGMSFMYGGMAFQPMQENGPPVWKLSIATPAPVLAANCN